MTTSRTRFGIAVGSAGLVAGLALGITGFASAADPTPSPGASVQSDSPREQFRERLRERLQHHKQGLAGRFGGGLVSGVSATSLSVRTPAGAKSIGLTGETVFYEGRTKSTRSAVEVGDIVKVRLVDPKADSPVAAVVHVVPAGLAGWVTAVDGGTLTITDRDGFTRTVTTSGSTEWRKDGEPATAAIATVGTFLRARGEVASNGTTLEATSVAVGKPAFADEGEQAPA
jgi:hypothetical protein